MVQVIPRGKSGSLVGFVAPAASAWRGISPLVSEQLQQSEEILTSEAAEKLQKRQQKIERWLSITGFSFTTLMALSVLIGLIYLLFGGSLPNVPGIVLLTLILGGSNAGFTRECIRRI